METCQQQTYQDQAEREADHNDEEVKKRFYEHFQAELEETPKHDMKFVKGGLWCHKREWRDTG